jgi:MFS family permease
VVVTVNGKEITGKEVDQALENFLMQNRQRIPPDQMDQANPLRNTSFRKLFAAQVIALVGTGLSTVALTLLAYDMVGGNAAAVLGTALAIKMVAYVLFPPIVGGLAHRFPRKPFLIAMDLVRIGIILAMPFVTEVWQIYLLIFLLNFFSAGFKPVFSATIPDILPNERQYTRALSMSRLAYDLENLLSPILAALALLFVTYTGLFITNAVAFLISAVLILVTVLPPIQEVWRKGTVWDEISFGVRAYLKTPRLRGLLALYMGVASASAMIIVNTVIYIREYLGGSESDVAMALAAAGGGSMIAAISLPKVLDRVQDRSVMLLGAAIMAAGLALISTGPSLSAVWPIWFLIGLGWSLVQTPAGRVVNRSSSPADRSAYFSAQFALSHACWLIFYLVAGHFGTRFGVETTALLLSVSILAFAVLAAMLWPKNDEAILIHAHCENFHEHKHVHGLHHGHEHEGWEGSEPHTHPHRHQPVRHAHAYVIDDHHALWPDSPNP